jgi:hypothetical protein
MSASGAGRIPIRDGRCLGVPLWIKVERREEQELEDAGWEQVEVQGRTYWCRPDTGHLYPRGPAYDVHKRRDQGRGSD